MIRNIINFYREGFAQMTIGKTLWAVIIVKLAVIFIVLRLFFMPDVLSEKAADGDKASYASTQITERAAGDK